MGPIGLLYGAYESRLVRSLDRDNLPRHVGVILDGNRRWAKEVGQSTAHGHQAGADKIQEFLGWCEEVGVEVVTVWLLSTDNLARPDSELEPLLAHHRGHRRRAGRDRAAGRSTRSVRSTCCPTSTTEALKAAEPTRRPTSRACTVNVAVGYGGRREIADAVRSLAPGARRRGGPRWTSLAEVLDVEHIADAPLHQGASPTRTW